MKNVSATDTLIPVPMNGKDAVRVTVSPETVLFKKSTAVQTSAVRVTVADGDTDVPNTAFACSVPSSLTVIEDGLAWYSVRAGANAVDINIMSAAWLHARQGAFLLGDVWRKDREQEDNGQDGFRRRTRRGFGALLAQGQRDAGRARRARDLHPLLRFMHGSQPGRERRGHGSVGCRHKVRAQAQDLHYRRGPFIRAGMPSLSLTGTLRWNSTFTGMTFLSTP